MDLTLSEISAIIDAARGNGFFASQLEASFAPFLDKLSSIRNDRRVIDFTDIFKLTDQDQDRYRRRYRQVMTKFMGVMEDKIGKLRTATISELMAGGGDSKIVRPPPIPQLVILPPAFNNGGTSGNDGDGDFESGETEKRTGPVEVSLVSVNDKILEQLGNISPSSANVEITETTKSKSSSGEGGGLFKKILGGLLVGGVAALGALLLKEGFLTDGGFKGTLKLLGLALIKPFLGIFDPETGIIGKFIQNFQAPKFLSNLFKSVSGFKLLGMNIFKPFTKLLGLAGKGTKIIFRGIPFLGSLISLAFAYSRFKQGDNLGGILELVAAIPFPPLSLAVGMFLAIRDGFTTKERRKNTVGSGILENIGEFFMNLPFVKQFTELFSGVYDFFTAKSGDDVDRAIQKLKNGASILYAVFPFFGYIFSIVDFFKIDSFDSVMKAVGSGVLSVGNFFTWIGGKIWNFFGTMGEWIGNMFSNLVNSKTFQIVSLKIKNVMLGVKKTIFGVIDTINTLMIGLAKQTFKIIDNAVVKKTLGFFGADSAVEGIENISKGLDVIGSNMADSVQQSIDSNNKKIKELEMARAEDQKKHDDKNHKETLDVMNNGFAATAGASNGTTAAVVAGNSIERSAGGNTTFLHNIDGLNGSRRSKDRSFRSIYGGAVPTN